VYLADEAFFTGTAAEVMPIVELDRRRIGRAHAEEARSTPGPITRKLQQAYFTHVRGQAGAREDWLTYV
jgi:branched-chain amino acid aminotransferase